MHAGVGSAHIRHYGAAEAGALMMLMARSQRWRNHAPAAADGSSGKSDNLHIGRWT